MRLALFVRTLEQGKGCAICGQPILSLGDMERDHPINLAVGGRDDESNEAAVHRACHQAKTQAESQRGKVRHT